MHILHWAMLLNGALLLVLVGMFIYRSRQYAGSFPDDTYITFRYAQHLAHGQGLVWNIGGPPTEGYTSPLHVGLLALGLVLGLDIGFTALVIDYLSVAGLLALALLLLKREVGQVTPVAIVALGVFFFDARLSIHAVAGLDTTMFMFLIAASLAAALALVERPGIWTVCALALSDFLALLARPDAALFLAGQALVVLAAALNSRFRLGKGILLRHAILSYVIVVGLGLAYMAWKYSYFGYLLPNPFYIKANDPWSLYGLPNVVSFLKQAATQYGLLVAVAVLFLNYGRVTAWWNEPMAKTKAALLVVPAVFFLLYDATVIHEVAYADRFEYPSYFFLALGVAMLLSLGARRRINPRWRPAGVMTAAALCGLVLIYKNEYAYFPWFGIMDNSYYRPIGTALRDTGLGPNAKLVLSAAGEIPYISEFSHIDPFGLTDNYLSGRVPADFVQRESYIWSQKPDVYIGPEPPASAGADRCGEDPLMNSSYVKEVLLPNNLYAQALLTKYGRLSKEERCELVHMRMLELRDNWVFLGEIHYPLPQPPAFTTFVYVRRESPYARQLAAALDGLIGTRPGDLDFLGQRAGG